MGSATDSDESGRDGMPLVWIVVLTWENYGEAIDCLDSLSSVTYPNFEVIVVDNGSNDGSYQRLQREFDWCTFVRNDENLGVTRGNNVGIERALSAGASYILLLNDDTIVTDDFLTPLVRTAERNPNAAVVGGINRYATSGEIHNAGAQFSTLLGGRSFNHEVPLAGDPYPVGYVPTCLALLDAEFVAEHDVLCESYFIGMEDVDLAWQARASGREVLVDPDSAIYHRLGQTSSRSPFAIYHRVRNRLAFADRHLSIPQKAVFLVSLCLWTAGSCLRWVALNEPSKIRALLTGVRDHTSNRRFRSVDELG